MLPQGLPHSSWGMSQSKYLQHTSPLLHVPLLETIVGGRVCEIPMSPMAWLTTGVARECVRGN